MNTCRSRKVAEFRAPTAQIMPSSGRLAASLTSTNSIHRRATRHNPRRGIICPALEAGLSIKARGRVVRGGWPGFCIAHPWGWATPRTSGVSRLGFLNGWLG
jgi:hypothetical protein